MSTSTPNSYSEVRPRKPLDSPKNVGGDMSMTFLARSQCPRKFTSSQQHQIKGLNVETVVGIFFPPPTWITSLNYSVLRADSEDDDSDWCYFSLNLPMYNQILIPSDWDDMWFTMNGRVHPYALTWEIAPNSLSVSNYTIPALIIRDQGYEQ